MSRRRKAQHFCSRTHLDYARIQEHGARVVVLHKLLHLGGQVGSVVTPDRMDSHRVCERDKVRVRHDTVRVAGAVEKVCRGRVREQSGGEFPESAKRRKGLPCHWMTMP
jgi:hypothetical protein